ncbi:MAG: 2-oxo acid dehydrogenase subunit E2 [Anaerolineaceae bacterium]|nr:2-oxo acid dehydrogenase subunit E2 [Anaerolineaceae bacterium]
MATDFYIPKLGQTVEEVTLIKWLVEDGAKVKRGDEVLEVETDKAVFPVEANGRGYVHFGPFKEGDVVPILTVVATIGAEDDVFVAGSAAGGSEPESVEETAEEVAEETVETRAAPAAAETETDRVFASPRARKAAEAKGVDLSKVSGTGGGGVRVVEQDVLDFAASLPKITPVAQQMAEAAGVDWTTLTGTGIDGKITKEDVEKASQPTSAPVVSSAAPAGVVTPVALAEVEVTERIPLKGVRKVIAERMAMSTQTTSRVTMVMDVDATEFVAARARLKERFTKPWGFAPGYNDLLAKIVATALRKFPYMNARMAPDAIEYLAHVNVAMAVDTERGLLVPVIRDADQKSLQEFGTEFRALVDRARNGRALPDDLTGGTFTITNLGMYDVEAFTPVINLPEAAILGVGKIQQKPVVIDGAIVVRDMWTLSLVFDHRIVDGAPAARFMQYIKQVIEDPYMLLV